jgi:hypothetical protein
MAKEETKFVTYQWLIGAILAVMAIMGTFTTIILTSMTTKFDSKVDKEVFLLQSSALQRSFDIQTQNITEDVKDIKSNIKELSDYMRATHKTEKK